MKDDWKKICRAADETKGQLLYYNGELVEQALFHSRKSLTCHQKTCVPL